MKKKQQIPSARRRITKPMIGRPTTTPRFTPESGLGVVSDKDEGRRTPVKILVGEMANGSPMIPGKWQS